MPASHSPVPTAGRAFGLLALGLFSVTAASESILESPDLAGAFVSPPMWQSLVGWFGHFDRVGDGGADVSFTALLMAWTVFAVGTLALGANVVRWRSGDVLQVAVLRWAAAGWLWWLLPGLWEIERLILFASGWESALAVSNAVPNFVLAVTFAGWGATFVGLLVRGGSKSEAIAQSETEVGDLGFRHVPPVVWWAIGVYVVVFVTMNWRLYDNLLVPHGDSAMYEEHLWNVVHGKGFRSYLDRNLFLGEHVQVIHLLLLPVHLVWSSLKSMEVCESLALSIGAIPVYWMARRHAGTAWPAMLLAVAYLCYVPLQMLDIAIDLKTFRPIAFGVPALLFGLDQLERRRFRSMLLLFGLALAAKEDYAIVIAPIGVWLAVTEWRRAGDSASSKPDESRGGVAVGLGLAVFATVYLGLVVAVVLPWFRGGVEIHYVGYFSRFGRSLGEVATNLLTNPALLFEALVVPTTFVYAIAILVPLGLLPVLAPWRLLVGLPLFVLLCLNEIAVDPRHHFHAPLIPVLLWAAAGGLGRLERLADRRFGAAFAFGCAVLTGATLGLHPFGMPFWDTGSAFHWRTLYGPRERATAFEGIAESIPRTARVYSTDFVHPRFTHHERSYDFSDYPRPSDAELEHPLQGETYYLVIDTDHPYSTVKQPADIHLLREHPEDWERQPLSNERFLVYRRVAPDR